MAYFKVTKVHVDLRRGFSLIEVMVVLAIMVLITGTVMSMFISIVSHQKKILEEQELLTQESYTIEYVGRALMMAQQDVNGNCLGLNNKGYSYVLTQYDAALGFYRGVKFINHLDNDTCEEFFLNSDNPNNPVFQEMKNNVQAENLVSDKFKIVHARFVLNGDKSLSSASQNDTVQPRITILLDITTMSSGSEQEKIIQTTVSQRAIPTT